MWYGEGLKMSDWNFKFVHFYHSWCEQISQPWEIECLNIETIFFSRFTDWSGVITIDNIVGLVARDMKWVAGRDKS